MLHYTQRERKQIRVVWKAVERRQSNDQATGIIVKAGKQHHKLLELFRRIV